ncbi:MAG: ATPase, T2SS/T4P/T4SS family [Gammaproteobacteria bacterium]|nr:ATPase, T2SS/T4P/T4SS family [Gammaproteobacteria bacterium]
MNAPKNLRLGDLLIADGVITQQQLSAALKHQKITGRKLGQQLVEDDCLSLQQLNSFLARQLNIPYINLRQFDIQSDIVRLLPEMQCRRCRAIVLGKGRDGSMVVGMADPTNIFVYDEITRLLNQPFRTAVVDEDAVLEVIERVYRRSADMGNIAQEFELDETPAEKQKQEDSLQAGEQSSDAPVVRFIQTMFEDALQVGASDIHIEPNEKNLIIRLRQDGQLNEQVVSDKRIATPVLSKLKLLAKLDISEKRLPQDGRFQLIVKGIKLDVRLSTMPIQDGESAVMRVLNTSNNLLDLKHAGMPPDILKRFRHLIHHPHGVILVTGPTGSGKTTTLYGALSELNSPKVKIVTVEDPVEYRLAGVAQVQVNQKIGLDFAQVLRAFLRQDPDVILVGEMRDQETVRTAMRAAMTGHLVLSSVHTNNAASTPLRLLDMGVEPFLITAGLRGILAQRLVRRICDQCIEPYQLLPEEREMLFTQIGERVDKIPFKHGAGCSYCNHTGYKGRVGVYELLELTPNLSRYLNDKNFAAYSQAIKSIPAYKTLRISALELALRGVTSLEEVFRASYSGDE